ncbi:MAG TPA: FtsX-like permease family protein [Steroidobacteraceae bacterium]|nr:FtsX-like permease family protein [Steroidobacteraceae bacterium]
MLLAALAWRNLWRRPQRTALSLASISIVAALLVFALSYQLAVYATMQESSLRILDGFAQIQPPGYADDPSIERTVAQGRTVAEAVTRIAGLRAAARVNAFAILTNGERSYGAAVVGVDPENEPRISSLAHAVRKGRYLEPSDEDAAVVGDTLARNLRLSLGARVTLLGGARDGSIAEDVLRVVGIYKSGVPELDQSLLQMPLSRAQETFGMADRANTIAVGGESLRAVNKALPSIRALGGRFGLSVLDWAALEPAMRDALALKYAISILLYLTMIAIVAFIILNTLLMSLLERTREFGVLLALGMRPGQIGRMVWMELLAMTLLGCLMGIAIGAGATLWFEQRGIAIPGLEDLLAQFGLPPRLYPTLDLPSVLLGPGTILGSVLLGGVAPYVRILRLSAARAMRVSG